MDSTFKDFEMELENTRQSVRKKIEARNTNKTAKKTGSDRKTTITATLYKPSSTAQPAKFMRERENVHDENRIHQFLIKNPHLIFTPRLYLGKLHLDSIISKRALSSEHIPDFWYVTCQANIIKITLIEIESSARKVFTTKQGTDHLHSDMNGPLRQVKEWQSVLISPSERHASFLKIKSLFDQYPYHIFDDNGQRKDIILRFDFLLIIGNPLQVSDTQQLLLDNILYEHNILVMTYPMMMEEAKKTNRQSNMLRINHKGIIVDTLQNGVSLVHKVPALISESVSISTRIHELKQHPDTDPHGLEMMGAGSMFRTFHYPHSSWAIPDVRHKIFQRAEGRCEIPGCKMPIISDTSETGTYILRRPQQMGNRYGQAVVMVCLLHANDSNLQNLTDGWIAGTHINGFAPYRAEYERAWHLFNSINIKASIKIMSTALNLNASLNSVEQASVKDWLLRVRSLPEGYARLLKQIAFAHLGFDHRPIPLLENMNTQPIYRLIGDLYRLGLISLEKEPNNLFKPVFTPPSDNFLPHLASRYGDELRRAITRIFDWDSANLTLAND
jgi:hypothetical protein